MNKGLLVYRLVVIATILLFALVACTSAQTTAPFAATPKLETDVPTSLEQAPQAAATATKIAPPTPTEEPATSTPLPTDPPPTETANPGEPPPLASIAMMDELNGWGLNRRGLLLKTIDGGITWEKAVVKPKGAPKPSPRVFFLDANNAWVVNEGEAGAPDSVFRTSDAGLTWQSAEAPFRLGNIVFLDPQNGWGLFTEDCGAGSCGGSLSRTTDGGTTWQVIQTIDTASLNDPNKIPLAGQKFGPSFVNSNQGWIGGSVAENGVVYLFLTQDGGVTWQHQDLELLPKAKRNPIEVQPPHFFTSQDGILSIFYGDQLFYTTKDGGVTWEAGNKVLKGGFYECASVQDCWVWANRRETIAVTHDGGQTWEEVKPNINPGDILQMDFVDASTGWALVKEARTPLKLLKTTDGGLTWEQVSYTCCK